MIGINDCKCTVTNVWIITVMSRFLLPYFREEYINVDNISAFWSLGHFIRLQKVCQDQIIHDRIARMCVDIWTYICIFILAFMLNLNHCLCRYYEQYSVPLLLFIFSLIWLCFIEGVQDVTGVNNRPQVVIPRWGRHKQSLSVSPPDFSSCSSFSSLALQNLQQTVNNSSSFFISSLPAF